MKKIILSIFFSVFAMSTTQAQTSVPGGNVSGTWTLAGSPYLISGNILLPNDSTLTIQPGVTVNFQGTYKLYVQGRLLAIGTVADTVTFTASDTTNGWLGIRFDNTPATNDTSRISFCKIEYGKATAAPDDNGGGIFVLNFSKVVISNSLITHCASYQNGGGIYCEGSNMIILNCIISSNRSTNGVGGGGIYCYGFSSGPNISYNLIIYNEAGTGYGGGILGLSGAIAIIQHNTISYNHSRNGGGIGNDAGTMTITNNIITFNTSNNGGGIYTTNNSFILSNIISNNTAIRA